MRRPLGAIAVFLLVSASVWAQGIATLTGLEGRVLVNQGEQFVSALPGQALAAGDRVMINGEGSALVVFSDGCDLRVESDTLVTVPAVSTCTGGVAQVQRLAPDGGPAIGAQTGTGIGVAGWLATAAFVAFSVCTVSGECDDDDAETISP